jgi:pimeloyl-ACP methyl ester carboxylesterase
VITHRGYGRPGAPVTVVLPGLGVSRYLRRAAAVLAERCERRVLLVEPPGFGSPLRATPTVESVSDALLPWLRGLGPVSLVGQSTGCLLAARLAPRAEVPDLALVGPVVDPAKRSLAGIGGAWLKDGRNEPPRLVLLEAPEWVRHARGLWPYLRSCLATALEDQLREVTCPVTVVRGDRDPLSSQQWAAQLADGPGRRLVVVPGGAHTFMLDRPGLMADALSGTAERP